MCSQSAEHVGWDIIDVESGPFPTDNLSGRTSALAAQGRLPVAPVSGLHDFVRYGILGRIVVDERPETETFQFCRGQTDE